MMLPLLELILKQKKKKKKQGSAKAPQPHSPVRQVQNEPASSSAFKPKPRVLPLRKSTPSVVIHADTSDDDDKTPNTKTSETTHTPPSSKSHSKTKQSNQSSNETTAVGDSTTRPTTKSYPFSTGNPTIETFQGVLHLYRNLTKQECRSNLLCIVAVPSFMALSDLCHFLSPHVDSIQKIRILRHVRDAAGGYMAILKFGDQTRADEFHQAYHGRPFTSMSPEICKVLYVAECHFDNLPPTHDTPSGTSSSNKDETCSSMDDFFSTTATATTPTKQTTGLSSSTSNVNNIIVPRTELPTCAVCLERLDPQSSGLLTIVCNHTFHCQCLAKWEDSSCPVCRYVQEPSQSLTCSLCTATNDLWMCLICGDVGCGRYSMGHAAKHFQATNHTYAIDLQHQRVWDYAGDGWVHRLLQNKADGKLVAMDSPMPAGPSNSSTNQDSRRLASRRSARHHEMDNMKKGAGEESSISPDAGELSTKDNLDSGSSSDDEVLDALVESKLDSITQEYTYLLTSQLEQQREYFEDRCVKIETRMNGHIKRLTEELAQSHNEIANLKATLANAEKEKKFMERKTQTQTIYINKLKQDIAFLESVSHPHLVCCLFCCLIDFFRDSSQPHKVQIFHKSFVCMCVMN
eukprot:c11055_g1_i1.p1 GENE.c11055_g1_i1~~c11055_g1_i1.p1  ORF type:complete len:631 (+),score=181.43 c11055_g1_i1:1148-3040(+)